MGNFRVHVSWIDSESCFCGNFTLSWAVFDIARQYSYGKLPVSNIYVVIEQTHTTKLYKVILPF